MRALSGLLLAILIRSAAVAGVTDWPELRRLDRDPAAVAVAALPVPAGIDPALLAALDEGRATVGEHQVQAQTVARWPDGSPRRLLLRWLDAGDQTALSGSLVEAGDSSGDAGWSFGYTLVASSPDTIPWKTALRNLPLAETQYEMHQLELRQGGRRVGLRLGLRRAGQLYWWQYVRADFVQRGPVFDLLRIGGPIYNEESTVQADLFLVLYRSGVVEAYAHFANHQREGVATETHGVPVIAFDLPGGRPLDQTLTGRDRLFDLGGCRLDLGPGAGYASPEHPGTLRTEEGIAVWQPWQDQAVWGELLVEALGVPDHRVEWGIGEGQNLVSSQRAAGHHYWLARWGDELIPRGLARSVRFSFSLGDAPPGVAHYGAPSWWHALAGGLPLGGRLPTVWWAVPPLLATADSQYTEPHPRGGYPFELGRSSRGNDGTLAAAMLVLGRAAELPSLVLGSLPPAYWWADVAIDHADFTVHELPKYSWQWIVQPYHRWLELVHAYWETGDPYLLETARFTADSYHRFFWTNRPHRFVGRDALPVADLLALWEGTGEAVYLQRAREILAEGRRSYGQTEWYWPGHQSGCGPNGVARQQDREYIPMVLAQLNAQLLQSGRGHLPPEEEQEIYAFLRAMTALVAEQGGQGWVEAGTLLSYAPLTALAERYPAEAEHWLGQLVRRNAQHGLPEAQSGARPYTAVVACLWLDAWAWGASWVDDGLEVRPQWQLLVDPRAPREAVVATPQGPVTLRRDGERVTGSGSGVRVRVIAAP
ncbi:MAG: hypothetical protein WDA75_02555 [Candidatus Latescibacterota bacterium]|jgi:hypothetical protein